jgi:hypothetical protein
MLKSYLVYIIIYSICLSSLLIGVLIEKIVSNSKENKFTRWWRNNVVGQDPYQK